MPVSLADLEQALRNALPIFHLDIIDQSSGCGESYAVLIVSEVWNVLVACRDGSRANHRGSFIAHLLGFPREDDAGKTSDGYVIHSICRHSEQALPQVNELLKDQIAQMHAFSQVGAQSL